MPRTYVITGAGSGIGLATAESLRAAGHEVIGVDLRGAEIEADLGAREGRVHAVQSAIVLSGGRVDAVIACAGIVHASPATVSVNYFGATELLEGLRPTLSRSQYPRAVLISSISAIQPDWPALTEALLKGNEPDAVRIAADLAASASRGPLIYSSSKRAVAQWVRTRATSADWAGAGITLNAVAPGVVATPLTRERLSDPEYRALLSQIIPMPLNGYQSPQTVADLLMWLTSPENSHCTGQVVFCDGGAEAVLRGPDELSWADEAIEELHARLGRATSRP